MFPFQKSGELSFQTADFVEEEENKIENQIFWTDADASAAMASSMNTNVGHGRNNNRGRGRGRGRGRRSADYAGSSNCNDDEEEKKKKSIHREIERQRRLEMSNLYSSLRSTLPPEYTKGRKSTSDHLAEAVNYIKDLEKNVKELADKRDELQAVNEMSTNPNYQAGGSSNNPRPSQGSVVIEPRHGAIAIDIDVSYEDENFFLSRALQIAFEEGLNVTSCTSTKNHDRIIHSIICEVNDITCIDFNRLQWRLNDLVN